MLTYIFAAFAPWVLFILLIFLTRKWLIKRLFTSTSRILLSDDYHENLLEMLPTIKRLGLVTTMENQLRAERGRLLYRSTGSAKQWPNLDAITFTAAQTNPFPIDKDELVDLSQTIGPVAKKPLKVELPLLIGGMAYGLSLSKEAKIALARASAKVKTAINSGEGGILPEEQEAAYKYILQFSKTTWAKDEKLVQHADMIEIKLGQGSLAGMGVRMSGADIPDEAKALLELDDDEDAVIHEHFFENQTVADLKELVSVLREVSSGVPIGFKIMASGNIEEDLDHLIDMNIDFIAVEGAQGGTHGSPPILIDDFGIPTLHAIVRAHKHLSKRKVKNRISLIASGGLHVPGDFLKALALGADAIYIGTAMLFAINHTQLLKPLPWEPPSQTIWSTGSLTHEFNVDKGVESGYNFLQACSEEMRIALRAMGKTNVKDLSASDLVTYDETISKMANIAYSFASQPTSDR